MGKITLTINGAAVTAEKDTTILAAALAKGSLSISAYREVSYPANPTQPPIKLGSGKFPIVTGSDTSH